MRTFVSFDQSYLVVDTTQRTDSVMIVLKAVDATPIFWSQERADLEGNIDAGGNPQAGMIMRDTDPPLVLIGSRMVVWARSVGQATKIECQVVSQKIAVSGLTQGVNSPGASPPRTRPRPLQGDIKLPGLEISWTRKGGVQ